MASKEEAIKKHQEAAQRMAEGVINLSVAARVIIDSKVLTAIVSGLVAKKCNDVEESTIEEVIEAMSTMASELEDAS